MAELNIDLIGTGHQAPSSKRAQAIYKPMVIAGNMLYVSGNVPIRDDAVLPRPRQGYDKAEASGSPSGRPVHVGNMRGELGSLNRVSKLVKTLGMVNCTQISNHPEVINGFSD